MQRLWVGCWLTASCAGRLFLRKLRDTLRIPVLALVDSDPYGLKILSVYMKGTVSMMVLVRKANPLAAACLAHDWCIL